MNGQSQFKREVAIIPTIASVLAVIAFVLVQIGLLILVPHYVDAKDVPPMPALICISLVGGAFLAVIILIAGIPAGIWLQWALWEAQLRPWAARSTTAVNDPVYDIPLQEDDPLPSNPAADPLYNTDADFTEAPAEPGLDPLTRAANAEEGTPPATS